MGEEIRDYAFEGSILFYGMLQHILFTMRITNSTYSLHQLVEVILSYLELIIPNMMQQNSLLISHSAIDALRSNVDKNVVTLSEIIEYAEDLPKQYPFNEEQQDLFDCIMSELQRERIRKAVIQPLLKPFQQLCNNTSLETSVHTFTNKIWHYLNYH